MWNLTKVEVEIGNMGKPKFMKRDDFDFTEKEFFEGMDKSGHVWCLHCERVYKKEDFINNAVKTDWAGCLSAGCSGAGWEVDIFMWAPDEFPRNSHPEYPEVPVVGKKYKLH